MARADPPEPLRVELVVGVAPRTTRVLCLSLPPGSTLADALRAGGVIEATAAALPDGLACGIWGRCQALSTLLRDGDRVEVYRALTVDPKEARRQRYKGQPKRKRPAGAGRS